MLQVRQVLEAACGFLVRFEICQGNDREFKVANRDDLPPLEAVVEFNAPNRCEYVYSKGRNPHPNNFAFHQEEGGLQVWGPETEFLEGVSNAGGVLGTDRDPNIEVGGSAWVAVKADSVPAYEKVLNSVRAE